MGVKQEIDEAESFLRDYEVLGDYIPTQKLLDVEGDMEVLVTEIRTPYKFWLQLKKRQIYLCDMFERMQHFYGKGETNDEQHRIPPEYIMLNQICAAIYQEDQVFVHIYHIWHPPLPKSYHNGNAYT